MSVQNLTALGFLLVIIGIVILMIGSLTEKNVKWAVGGFIGPIPFGAFNDKKLMWAVITISLIMLLIFIVPWIKQLV